VLAVLLTQFGLGLAFLGVVGIVRPIRRLRMRSRARALAVAVAGALVAAGGSLLPAATHAGDGRGTELDRALPAYQFNEFHSIEIRASADRVYRAVKAVEADDILFFRTLVWLRRFGRSGPETILNPAPDRPLLQVATMTTFAMLADTPREVVTATQVAAPPGFRRRHPPTREDILAARSQPGFAVAALNFVITPRADGRTIVATETRVFATDPTTRRRFGVYWRIIYPGSALIRRMWLRAIRDRAEAMP
jgi:hypothetical protein